MLPNIALLKRQSLEFDTLGVLDIQSPTVSYSLVLSVHPYITTEFCNHKVAKTPKNMCLVKMVVTNFFAADVFGNIHKSHYNLPMFN